MYDQNVDLIQKVSSYLIQNIKIKNRNTNSLKVHVMIVYYTGWLVLVIRRGEAPIVYYRLSREG